MVKQFLPYKKANFCNNFLTNLTYRQRKIQDRVVQSFSHVFDFENIGNAKKIHRW